MYVYLLPADVSTAKVYLAPEVKFEVRAIVIVPLVPLARLLPVSKPKYVKLSSGTSSIVTDVIVNASAPVFVQWMTGVERSVNVTLVIFSSSVFMKVNVSAPIQAATAIETATVTAISMIAATTGLKAFLLFRSFFIFGFFPPCRVHKRDNAVSRFKSYDLRHYISKKKISDLTASQSRLPGRLLYLSEQLQKELSYLLTELGFHIIFLQRIDGHTLGQA